jgi:hypothetical protein
LPCFVFTPYFNELRAKVENVVVNEVTPKLHQTNSFLGLFARGENMYARGLVVRVSGFDSRRWEIFCVAVGLERGTLSLMRINEEVLERKVAASA